MPSAPIDFNLHLADNALVLGHRNSEWTGHGPILEQDIALSNIALDLIGQSRNFYQHAAELTGNGSTEDSLAYLRTAHEFKNFNLAEQENGDWGKTVMRQFLFSAYQLPLYQEVYKMNDPALAAIAEKSLKEVTYHLRWSSEWVIRLGQGTTESSTRMRAALGQLWKYTGQFQDGHSTYQQVGINAATIFEHWKNRVEAVLEAAAISIPIDEEIDGGQEHTEALNNLLQEMQYMQRTYPGMEW